MQLRIAPGGETPINVKRRLLVSALWGEACDSESILDQVTTDWSETPTAQSMRPACPSSEAILHLPGLPVNGRKRDFTHFLSETQNRASFDQRNSWGNSKGGFKAGVLKKTRKSGSGNTLHGSFAQGISPRHTKPRPGCDERDGPKWLLRPRRKRRASRCRSGHLLLRIRRASWFPASAADVAWATREDQLS
jgi:hypothetical protein